ncbi:MULTISPECIES: hypothetical protein [Actinomadura]|uniref:Uncharacterized protein n=1 Tax=Actinomadura madurae TaxID=1993 RepID=A0A1I4X1D5_9ACTN|nr:hypothetical protein [Actinomadura madurae]SFN19465.1 hypothetical protein SAMN04489713_101623 [Actinomadura madurae]SPT62849.1 Uncharacterised protein [Actinomadura madurae]
MSDRPGDALDEAAKLFDALIRRVSGAGGGDGRAPRDEPADDVWDRATREDSAARTGEEAAPGPRIATGAPECRDCPVCRAIAMKRESGGDVARHLREAGESLLAAALDVVGAFDRTRPRGGGAGAAGNPPPADAEASRGARAGTSERSGRPEPGDPWSAATGGGPIDIG